ncbi:MAG: hypothetical protein A3C90_00020 [Candidatus Magasanikbacteria bacterium RIFCSPHIGHO2_02_FULL_51_14]|uniref:Uncharacterized protein n=1 Tax=Candidatus Magasanikbacteria bacterium RIFCSPHIGHO2_02_FULL_51_14 TaxID=1798683 RepID=A0A1F6MCW7_9BACT|nr:MAG: hypothetical protein A3C90_00020 [Candidatus Magasanikbacteria bacterium RIFCSPHIGHO2_02_FULL_51_14]
MIRENFYCLQQNVNAFCFVEAGDRSDPCIPYPVSRIPYRTLHRQNFFPRLFLCEGIFRGFNAKRDEREFCFRNVKILARGLFVLFGEDDNAIFEPRGPLFEQAV